jgi:hypothetical protein
MINKLAKLNNLMMILLMILVVHQIIHMQIMLMMNKINKSKKIHLELNKMMLNNKREMKLIHQNWQDSNKEQHLFLKKHNILISIKNSIVKRNNSQT